MRYSDFNHTIFRNIHCEPSAMPETRQQEVVFNTKESQHDVQLGKYEVGKDKKMLPNFKGKKNLSVNLHYSIINKSNVWVSPGPVSGPGLCCLPHLRPHRHLSPAVGSTFMGGCMKDMTT